VDFWPYVIVAVGAVVLIFIMFLAIKTGKRKKEEKEASLEVPEVTKAWPIKTARSITIDEAEKARTELRMLDLERGVLSDAIRRLYEAQAEGKISEEERELLAERYKERMMEIKDTISKSESVVTLHELETMQEDLLKLFNERFDELCNKIEEVRSRLGVEPIKEAPIPTPTPTPPSEEKEEKRKVRKPAPPPRKTEAEKRIEEIKAEVEKVLERLGQIEVEA